MADQFVTTKHEPHLSIGEVLGLLLEEFPDVTISKIRFLESQGLIAPERTSSGYRKFQDPDVELLRCILREQKENFLPLRVIKDRLDSGELDPTIEHPRPRGIKNVSDPDGPLVAEDLDSRAPINSIIPGEPLVNHPSGRRPFAATLPPERPPAPSTPTLLPGALLDAAELCGASGISIDELRSLEQYGVVASHRSDGDLYDDEALEIASICRSLLRAGIDARHLRGWRVAADREAGLFEQLVQPLVRQRNPASHAQALETLTDLDEAGGRLRQALMRSSLRRFSEF